MSTIETAARALVRAEYYGSGYQPGKEVEGFVDQEWPSKVDQVRVVLQALREPTEAMIYANSEGGLGFNDQVVRDWQAMIDAALEDG